MKRLKGEETEEVKTNVEFSVYDLATEESTPPLMATTTRVSFIPPVPRGALRALSSLIAVAFTTL